MHLLYSTALGIEVIDEVDHHVYGVIADMLIDPDCGKIIAFFIASPHSRDHLILQTQDVASWGNRVHIRDPEVMGEVDDCIRLAPLMEDERTVLNQKIRTKGGAKIGKCVDIQFRTDTFDVEWIFPRRFFKKGLALPTSEILEITKDAIIIKEQIAKEVAENEVIADVKDASIETAVSPATRS